MCSTSNINILEKTIEDAINNLPNKMNIIDLIKLHDFNNISYVAIKKRMINKIFFLIDFIVDCDNVTIDKFIKDVIKTNDVEFVSEVLTMINICKIVIKQNILDYAI